MKHIKFYLTIIVLFLFVFKSISQPKKNITVVQQQYQVPLLKGKKNNPFIRIKVLVTGVEPVSLESFHFSLKGTTSLSDIQKLKIYYFKNDSATAGSLNFDKAIVFGCADSIKQKLNISGTQLLEPGIHFFWLSCELNDKSDLFHVADANFTKVVFDSYSIKPIAESRHISQRFGIALRQHNDDGVDTYRIPGLTTSPNGTLLATYDLRRESSRDLQGNIDIGLNRSNDSGNTWEPMQIVMDMGEWGGLPQKFNGISDACILSDDKTGTIYIAGLWMHGVLDKNGKWIEGLTNTSKDWNHQWADKGSQSGFDVKQTSQFLIVKSTDNGKTWSQPVNITQMCKKDEWWLLAPGPGHGITLSDGTLVFPTQGRDKYGKSFSNITYSKDGGVNWITSAAADTGTTSESMAVQLKDGSIMLNMRASENRYRKDNDNGRAIAVTYDFGKTWTSHLTSRSVLNEPTCMASIHKHQYTERGQSKSVLLFSNPNTKSGRQNMTIKVSFDEGLTWPKQLWLLLDEWKSFGYSCLTSIDEKTIGILYEGSGAQMVFQKISINNFLRK